MGSRSDLSRRCLLRLPFALFAPSPPSSLRLQSRADQDAFRRWFTFLAEWTAFADPLPREVTDCSALLRFAAREALREHNGRWLAELGLPAAAPFPDVRQYRYPHTPAGPNLFATASGEYREFADAQSLLRFNSHRVSRDLQPAQPGDLLFFRQWTASQPYHSMVFLSTSHFDNTAEPLVVYHTGPSGRNPGEVRRPTIDELRRHPNPQWRPHPGNANFLGVYRWNLLEEPA